MVDRTGSKEYPITYKPDFVSHEQKVPTLKQKDLSPRNTRSHSDGSSSSHWLQINEMSEYRIFLPKNQTQVDQAINILLGNEQETIRVLPDVTESGTKKHNKNLYESLHDEKGNPLVDEAAVRRLTLDFIQSVRKELEFIRDAVKEHVEGGRRMRSQYPNSIAEGVSAENFQVYC
jgi:hypothetical protein